LEIQYINIKTRNYLNDIIDKTKLNSTMKLNYDNTLKLFEYCDFQSIVNLIQTCKHYYEIIPKEKLNNLINKKIYEYIILEFEGILTHGTRSINVSEPYDDFKDYKSSYKLLKYWKQILLKYINLTRFNQKFKVKDYEHKSEFISTYLANFPLFIYHVVFEKIEVAELREYWGLNKFFIITLEKTRGPKYSLKRKCNLWKLSYFSDIKIYCCFIIKQ
jgi:hypothetical protein